MAGKPLENKLVVRIEAGHLYYERHGGNWLDDGLLDYLTSAFEDEMACLEMEPEADRAIEISRTDPSHVFLATIYGPYYDTTGGYFEMGHMYNTDVSLVWNGPVEVKEVLSGG